MSRNDYDAIPRTKFGNHGLGNFSHRVQPVAAFTMSAGGVTAIENQADIKRLTEALQRSLRKISPGSKIVSCDVVVRSDEPSGHDEIYGASCMVTVEHQKQKRLLMCDDSMVDKFTLTSQYFWGTPQLDVIGSFVRSNCPAGG